MQKQQRSQYRNFLVKMSAVLLISACLIWIGFSLINTLVKSDDKIKYWTNFLAVSCNLYSVTEGKFPADKAELLKSRKMSPSDPYMSSISYSLNPDGKNGTLTANLMFGRQLTVLCSGEEL